MLTQQLGFEGAWFYHFNYNGLKMKSHYFVLR